MDEVTSDTDMECGGGRAGSYEIDLAALITQKEPLVRVQVMRATQELC